MNNIEFAVMENEQLEEVNGGSRGESIIGAIGSVAGVCAGVAAGAPVAIVAGCIAVGYYVTKAIKG